VAILGGVHTLALDLATYTVEAAIDTLADHLALELSKHARHLKYCAARRRRGVERLRVDIETDVPLMVSSTSIRCEIGTTVDHHTSIPA
jgi:hypothetical protein